MATRFIPYRPSLPKRLEISRLADRTGRPRSEVVVLMMELWLWLADAGEDFVPGLLLCDLPQVIPDSDLFFFQCLEEIGILVQRPDGIAVPGYERNLDDFIVRRRQLLESASVVPA